MEKKARAVPTGKEQGMTYYKPLTPEFRARINESVRSIEIELDTCQNTPYVTAQKIGLQALENLINALPDGFPLPMKRRDNHDGE